MKEGVSKMVCDKDVCKMEGDKVVCEDGVTKMVGDNVVCERL